MKGLGRVITSSALGAAALLAGCNSSSFRGEWIRGDWDTQSALAACREVAKSQSYPAECEASNWNATNNYGEVWLVNTNSDRTESGEEITKIWVLKRQ